MVVRFFKLRVLSASPRLPLIAADLQLILELVSQRIATPAEELSFKLFASVDSLFLLPSNILDDALEVPDICVFHPVAMEFELGLLF